MRQVSFTLLMRRRRRRYGNSAQYERNRRFGHLVDALGREADGAKLPSGGLRLNASKSESRPVRDDTMAPLSWEAADRRRFLLRTAAGRAAPAENFSWPGAGEGFSRPRWRESFPP